METWNWDSGVTGFEINIQIAGYRTNAVETIVSTNVVPHPTDPAVTFSFTSDGVSAYDFSSATTAPATAPGSMPSGSNIFRSPP